MEVEYNFRERRFEVFVRKEDKYFFVHFSLESLEEPEYALWVQHSLKNLLEKATHG